MKTALALCLGLLAAPISLPAFGPEGHQLVGALAQARLAQTEHGRQQLAKALALLQDADDAQHQGLSLQQAGPMPDDIRTWDTLGKTMNPDQLRATYPKVDAVPAIRNYLGVTERVGASWPRAVQQQMWEYFVANSQPDQFEATQAQHHVFHFCDIAVGPGADLTYNLKKRGCNPHDIVHMIAYCAAVLDGETPADPPARNVSKAVALVLLVHLLGDLHQPLHVGAQYFDPSGHPTNPDSGAGQAFADAGGNFIRFDQSNLHSHWDDAFVFAAVQRWGGSFQLGPKPPLIALATKLVAQQTPAALPEGKSALQLATGWAEESVRISREAHERLTFSNVTIRQGGDVIRGADAAPKEGTVADYQSWAAQQLMVRIPLAGDRLAWLIEHAKL